MSSAFPQLRDNISNVAYPLSKRITTIGSAQECYIRLESGSPARAAHVFFEAGTFVLHRLSDGISIFINNTPCKNQVTLSQGDLVKIGKHEFTFLADPPDATNRTEHPSTAFAELIGVIVSLLKSGDRDVFSDLVMCCARLLQCDAARLVFEDPLDSTRTTVARYPQETGIDRFSNRAIDWARDAACTIMMHDADWLSENSQTSLERNNIASILCAPLKDNDVLIGYLYLDRLQSNNAFTESDRELCDALLPLFIEILGNHSMVERQRSTIVNLQKENLVHTTGMIYKSKIMAGIIDQARTFAKTSSPVLISGPTGTGKELMARFIHAQSGRKGAFQAINVGALPESLIESELFGHEKGAFTGAHQRKTGLFETAHEGSLFLDEITECTMNVQVKLLRALQEGEITRIGGTSVIPVSVRIIAATNKLIDEEVSAGRFREDLNFRLNVLSISIPPLRDRGDDILLLADQFIVKYCQQFGLPNKTLTPSASALLERFQWPGNVRQLENVIQKAILTSRNNRISRDDIPLFVSQSTMSGNDSTGLTLKDVRNKAEKEVIVRTLAKTRGNISLSSKLLAVDRKWLMKIMDDLHIDANMYRG